MRILKFIGLRPVRRPHVKIAVSINKKHNKIAIWGVLLFSFLSFLKGCSFLSFLSFLLVPVVPFVPFVAFVPFVPKAMGSGVRL